MSKLRGGSFDLRTHLAGLREAGLLVDIDRPVDPDTQAAWLMADLARRGLAGQFASVGGSTIPLLYNGLGTRAMVALALGTAESDITEFFADHYTRLIEPQRTSDPAACQEVVRTGDEATLDGFPLVTHSADDAGRYITAGMVICHDPDTGARNVSVNRITPVTAPDLAIRMMPPQQLGQIQAKAEQAGQDLPIAVAIGMHPTAVLAAASSPPLGVDELAVAGGLRGEPVPMVAGVSVPIDVPAEAEIVIEGWVRANIREPEGPFGDFLDYYVPQLKNHRVRVSAITHRRDPIYQTMHAGSPEDVNILGLSREAAMRQAVLATGTDLRGVRLRPTILGVVIAIRPRFEGEAKQVAMAAFGAYRWLKYCIIVDPDVAIEDDADVLWAIATRSSFAQDIVVIPNTGGFPRDEGGVHDAKLLIDATAPLNESEAFRRRRPPGVGPLRLEDFISDVQGRS